MAADTDMEKTEDPTSKKLEQAAEKGNIARSKELATALVLLGSSVGILIFGKEVANTTLTVCKRLLSLNYKDIFDENAMFTAMGAALTEVQHGDGVDATLRVPESRAAALVARINDAGQGRVVWRDTAPD